MLESKIQLLDYRAFVDTFIEIFVRRDYAFEAKSDSPVIIDCGSNIGMSVFFFKYAYPNCRVIAFEPDPETFQVLKTNAEMNQWGNVELHNVAVFPTEGIIDFYSDPDRPGSLVMSTCRGRFSRGPDRPVTLHKVQARRLSPYIQEEVDFLKMDIEGIETAVMEELAQCGKLRLIRQMVLEYHHHLDPEEDRLSGLLQLLEMHNFGYQFHVSTPRPFVKKTLQDILLYAYQRE